MSLRIARIETFLYRAEVEEPMKTSFGSIPRRSSLLPRIEDTEGAHRWGEVWCNFPTFALGRKNYLFCGSDAGGERAAAMYSIMQTAKLNGVNPEAYLRDTLTKIADGHPISRIDELMQ